jgi:hypothetical protein
MKTNCNESCFRSIYSNIFSLPQSASCKGDIVLSKDYYCLIRSIKNSKILIILHQARHFTKGTVCFAQNCTISYVEELTLRK